MASEMTTVLNEANMKSSKNPDEQQKNNTLTRNYQLIIIIVLLLATFTRFWDLGTENFWYDEYALVDHTDSFSVVIESLREYLDPPLMVILGYSWRQIFGDSEVGTRSLSAVLGVASIGMLYLVAKQLYNEQVALLSAGLAAFSGYLIYHSQDYRYYSLLMLLTLLSYYFFMQFILRGNLWYILPYILFSSLAYYTHFFGIFMLLAQGVYFLLCTNKYKHLWRSWFISQIVIFALILPHLSSVFLPVFMADVSDGTSTRLQWISVLNNNSPLIATIKYIIFNKSYVQLPSIALAGLILGLGIAFRIAHQRTRYFFGIQQDLQNIQALFTEKLSSTLLVITWFALIMFTPYAIHLVIGNVFVDRYVIGAAPAFFILLAVGLYSMRRSIPLYASIGALLIVMLFGLQTYYSEPTKEEWQQVFNIIEENETANDLIIYNLGIYRPNRSLRYDYAAKTYYQGSLERCLYYEDQLDNPEFSTQLATCIGHADYLWIIMREYDSGNNRTEGLSDYLNETFNAELVNRTIYYGIQLLEYQRLPND